jgi:hypothetical protein
MRLAARMNRGTARSVKLLSPLNIFVKTTVFGIAGIHAIPVKEMMPRANAIGTPIAMNPMNMITNIAPSIKHYLL